LSPTQLRSGAGFLLRRVAAPGALRDRAEQTAAVLPPLLVVAERVAVTVAQGVHGRRRVGQGETFWQFRQYEPGDAATRIDWRESAKSQRLYVRQTEWEAAQSVWLWRDASASMDYTSADYIASAEWPTKRDRAELLLVALASLLVRGGERLTLLGSGISPMSGRIAMTESRVFAAIIPAGSRAIAMGLPRLRPRWAGAVAFIALIAHRTSPCWRCMPHCRPTGDGERWSAECTCSNGPLRPLGEGWVRVAPRQR